MGEQIFANAVRGLAVTAILMTAGFGPSDAAAAATTRVRLSLTPTGVAPAARGKAQINQRANKAKFSVSAGRLARHKSFDLIVGGVKVGTLLSNGVGGARLRFNTKPGSRSKDSLLGFEPRGEQISVRDQEDGEDVLVGAMDDDDPAHVACCLTEVEDGGETEVECEDLSSDACTAAGGAVQTTASCLPDPCATTPSEGEEIICCTNETHDDESETECEDVSTPAACVALGGTVVEAASCDSNPCVVTPPAGEAACCITHQEDDGETEVECEVTSAAACTALGGTSTGGSTCDGDPCHAGSPSGAFLDGKLVRP